MSFLLHLKDLLGRKVVAFAGAAMLIGGDAAMATPATTNLEVVPASGHGALVEGDEENEENEEPLADARDTGTGGANERSDVATDVHEALAPDRSPGDAGFGRSVAATARDGGNGKAASLAAREAKGSADRGRAPRVRGAAGAGVEAAPRGRGPEGAGPPPHTAKSEGR